MCTRTRYGYFAPGIVICSALAGCGGGGGGSSTPNPSMSLTPSSVSVSADFSDSSPTATVKVTVADPPASRLYAEEGNSNNGISSVNISPIGNAAYDLKMQFYSPGVLGVGTYDDTVTVRVCRDAQCDNEVAGSPQTIHVRYKVNPNPVPSLSSLSPDSRPNGSGEFTLTVKGTKFVPNATVDWNGHTRATNYVSSSELTAAILASDVATSGAAAVTVANPSPGGGSSNTLAFNVPYGTPTLGKMFPDATVESGPKFTLTILGTGFGPESQVQWNDSPRSTRFVSGVELAAKIDAADISTVGTAAVTVLNPAPGTRSAPATFAINPTTSSTVAFQIDPEHSGDMNFDPVTFPAQSAWTANVNGQPSYALIADGKVFVTVDVSGNSQLVALDQKTGAVAWGPISLSGAANAAYDADSVFVVSGNFGSADVMQAYNATTGNLEWSTRLGGQYAFSSGPTARDGFVYTGGAGTGGTLYALNESDGSIVWTEPVENGDDSTPAVTADGVFVTYPCQVYDFRAGTGELVWRDQSGCEGGGGATPVTANGTLYAPNEFGDYNGDEFDAETGQLTGSYTADIPPAIGKDDGYFLQNGTLDAVKLSNNTILWSFTGDGNLVTSPIVVNQYVIVGSSSGNLYALDKATGQQVWNVNVGAAIPSGAGWGAGIPLSGLSAGHGLLIVPAGNSVIAYRLAND